MAIIKTLNGWLNRLKEKGRKTSKAKETSQSRDGTSTSTPSTETPSLPNPKRSVPKLPVHPVAKPVMTPSTIVARSAYTLDSEPVVAAPQSANTPAEATIEATAGSQRTHTPSLLKKTPIWKRAIEKWMIDHPSEYAALGDLGDDPDPKRWTQFQPAAETSQQTTLRLKRWVPVLASVRGIAAPIAALDPHKVAPIICASVFFGIEILFGVMNPEQRDKLLDILVSCTQVINEAMLFETTFHRGNYPGIEDHVPKLNGGVFDQYLRCLSLTSNMKYFYRDDGPEVDANQKFFTKAKDWVQDRGRKAWASLSSKVTYWEAQLKEINRIRTEWLGGKKAVDSILESDKFTKSVLAWIKQKDDQELLLDTIQQRLMPDGRYGDSAQWFLSNDKFLEWCSQSEKADANDMDGIEKDANAPKASKRLFWVRGALGTGKTNVLYHTISALRFQPEFQPQGAVLRISWYFCDANNAKLKEVDGYKIIIRALASRLALLPDFTLAHEANVRYNIAESTRALENDYTADYWKELFKAILKGGLTPTQFVIIVDALDECSLIEAEKLVEFMLKTMQEHPNLRFLCSSHQQVRVKYLAQKESGSGDIPEIEMTEEATAQSMKTFITSELAARQRTSGDSIFYPTPDKPNGLLKELENLLISNAHGMFQWVQIWLDILLPANDDLNTIRSLERAKMLLKELRSNANVEELTAAGVADENDIDDEHRADSRLRNPYQTLWRLNSLEDYTKHRIRLFHILLRAFQPLTLEQLRDALCIQGSLYKEEIQVKDIKRLCMNFLFENTRGYLVFSHDAARRFVLNMTVKDACGKGTDGSKQFTEKLNHIELAETYINVMRLSTHPYWKHIGLNLDVLMSTIRPANKRQIDLDPNSTIGGYLVIYGIRHCFAAAEKSSMFDKIWVRFLDEVVLLPTSALTVLATNWEYLLLLPEGNTHVLRHMCIARKGQEDIELLYSHVLALLNIIDEDDVCRLQPSYQNLQSPTPHSEEARYHQLFRGANIPGGISGGRVTALQIACLLDNRSAVEAFLYTTHYIYDGRFDAAILSQAFDNYCNVPLCMAIYNQQTEIAKKLLAFETNYPISNEDSASARSASGPGVKVAQQWSFRCSDTGRTALSLAAQFLSEEETLKLLSIARPADIDIEDKHGITTLHVAAGYGHRRLVAALEETYKAKSDAQDHWGQTPTQYADSYSRRSEAEENLSSFVIVGADVDRDYLFPWRRDEIRRQLRARLLDPILSRRHSTDHKPRVLPPVEHGVRAPIRSSTFLA